MLCAYDLFLQVNYKFLKGRKLTLYFSESSYASLYHSVFFLYLSNKFYLNKRTCAQQLNSMITDCGPPQGRHRYVQYVRQSCTSELIMIKSKTPDIQYTC